MSRSFAACALLAGMALLTVQVQPLSGQGQARGRGFGRAVAGTNGRKAIRAEMPADAGAKNGVDAVEALKGELGQKVRDRGQDPERYAALLAMDESVWIDGEGQLAFLDVMDQDDVMADGVTATSDPLAATGPAPIPTSLQANGLPIHHSKSGAPFTMYLDFEPEVLQVRFQWRQFLGSPRSVINTVGLSIDGNALQYNAEEQAVISRTWGRVAEDWAPFDVDVTTERPSATNFNQRVLWNIVTRSGQELGFSPFSLAGIAFAFDLCGSSAVFGPVQPTFTFWNVWGPTNHSDIADTISHEAGHVTGLVHDGQMFGSSFSQYYFGHGTGPTSWAPIMGYGGQNVTQWSRGDYPNASNGNVCGAGFQDDIAILAGKLGVRADDFGDSLDAALPMALPTFGVITSTTDVDVFALPRANDVRIEITPFRAGELTDGGNLDVAAEIVNAAGLVVASVDDLEETAATLSAILPPGQHYLRVKPSFNPVNYPAYGSLGQYTVTGTFKSVVRFTGFDAPLPADVMTPGRTVPVKFALTDAVSAARVQLWSDPSPLAASVLADTACRAQAGFRQHCNLKLPKDLTSAASYSIVAQYQDLNGQWVTAQLAPGSTTSNPLPFVAR